MQLIKTPLQDAYVVQLQVHGDARGFFVERFHSEKLAAQGLALDCVQDNHSRSAPGVLRGLHFQADPPQGKLVGCVRGRIWDVAVDARPASPTFGQWHAEELSDINGKLLWIPPGFLHGFCVLGDEPADVLYKVTGRYNPASEVGVHYADPQLNITWPGDSFLVSDKDKALGSFADYQAALR